MEAGELKNRLGDFQLVAGEVLRDVRDITPQQVKHWIVNPFLVSLGWDPHDKKQVFLDYAVKPEGHVDYALLDTEGRPRLILQVRTGGTTPDDLTEIAKKAGSVGAPLVMVTNGGEFSLWYLQNDEAPAPLFVLELKDLADHAEELLGIGADYRLSETGIQTLRRSAIRTAVIQFLEENSEKTFDAIVGWVSDQVAPGALDDSTDQAIREGTMLWLTEEHQTLPGFAGADGKRPHDLRATHSREWEPFPRGPPGAFQYRYDTSKTLDLRQSPQEVRAALRLEGFRMPTPTSFGGFYYTLRQRAGLPAASTGRDSPKARS